MRQRRHDLGHGVAVSDDERAPAAVFAQHAARQIRRESTLASMTSGLRPRRCASAGRGLLRAARIGHVDPADAAEGLVVAEHLREAARRGSRPAGDSGASLMAPTCFSAWRTSTMVVVVAEFQ